MNIRPISSNRQENGLALNCNAAQPIIPPDLRKKPRSPVNSLGEQ